MSQEVPGNGFPEGYRPYAAMPPAPVRRRRGRWVVVGVLVALLILSIPTFIIVRYITRSTPNKTLDAFCTDVQKGDYQSAYDQFSTRLQHTVAEAAFAAILANDRVSACTHGAADEASTSVTNTLKLVHVSKGINSDIVTLTKDSNDTWKIDDIARQT